MKFLLLVGILGVVSPETGTCGVGNAATVSDVAINHTYEARIRVNGKVSPGSRRAMLAKPRS